MLNVKKTQFCEGISDISDSYSGFIIDQWGVLHNGETVYEDVIECLKELKARKKYVIILSNSGKRAEENKERLKKLGIGPSLYSTIVTSGEMTWQGLEHQNEGVFKDIGTKCYLISRGGDRSIIKDSKVELVDDIAKADFLLISGLDSPDKTLEDYEPVLKHAVRKQMKCLCANPDMRGVMGGMTIMGPGTLAQRFQDFGGVVHYIGKPHQPIFQHCIKLLQDQEIYPGETVVIGDTMGHDILGGALANMDTCLVKTGLHEPVFRKTTEPGEVNAALNLLAGQFNNIRPKYLVDSLKWGKPLPDRKHKKRSK